MTPPLATTAEAGVPEKADDDARLMTHAYDGIREYDNPLPGWWRALFWGTIVFAAGYWVWFHVAGWGNTPEDKYKAALVSYESKRADREAADAASVSEELLARNAHDDKLLTRGAEIFATRCASCHTENGRGLIGPNLTDNYQLHGSSRMDILKTVRTGVPGTAMLAWGEQMPPAEIVAVASFVVTLRGQNIKGKEPQGAPVEPFK